MTKDYNNIYEKLKFIQINLQKSMSSTPVLAQHMLENEIDIAPIQEPHVVDNQIRLFPINLQI
jgi:hypothetical protein